MTWSLIVQSFAVLRRDKKLVLFPALSALAAVAVSAPFWVANVRDGARKFPALDAGPLYRAVFLVLRLFVRDRLL
jgi:hypothetical protein